MRKYLAHFIIVLLFISNLSATEKDLQIIPDNNLRSYASLLRSLDIFLAKLNKSNLNLLMIQSHWAEIKKSYDIKNSDLQSFFYKVDKRIESIDNQFELSEVLMSSVENFMQDFDRRLSKQEIELQDYKKLKSLYTINGTQIDFYYNPSTKKIKAISDTHGLKIYPVTSSESYLTDNNILQIINKFNPNDWKILLRNDGILGEVVHFQLRGLMGGIRKSTKLRQEGDRSYENGDYSQAQNLYHQAIQQRTNCFFGPSSYPKAEAGIKKIEEIVHLNKIQKSAKEIIRNAESAYEEMDYKKAKKLYLEAIEELKPYSGNLLQAKVKDGLKKVKDAHFKTDKKHVDQLSKEAEKYYQEGRREKARDIYSQILETLKAHQKHSPEIENALKEVQEKILEETKKYSDEILKKAEEAYSKNDYEKAQKLYSEVIEILKPYDICPIEGEMGLKACNIFLVRSIKEQTDIINEDARHAFEEGHYEEAIMLYSKVLKELEPYGETSSTAKEGLEQSQKKINEAVIEEKKQADQEKLDDLCDKIIATHMSCDDYQANQLYEEATKIKRSYIHRFSESTEKKFSEAKKAVSKKYYRPSRTSYYNTSHRRNYNSNTFNYIFSYDCGPSSGGGCDFGGCDCG